MSCECGCQASTTSMGNFRDRPLADFIPREYRVETWFGPGRRELTGLRADIFGEAQEPWIAGWKNEYVAGSLLAAVILLPVLLK